MSTTAITEAFEFVGGPYDGRHMPLDGPEPREGTELLVHETPGSGTTPEFYVLRADGRFHHVPSPEPRAQRDD